MTRSMETYIKNQMMQWEQKKEASPVIKNKSSHKDTETRPFVTISREYGCGGFEIASEIVEILNDEFKSEPVWAAYDKKILEKLSSDMGFTTKLANTLTDHARGQMTNLFQTTFSAFPSKSTVYLKMAEVIRTLAVNGNVILVGRGGNAITKDMDKGLHIRIIAPLKWREERISRILGVNKKEATKIIKDKSKKRHNIIKEMLNFDISDPYNYHYVINDEKFTIKEAAHIIIEGIKIKGLLTDR